MPTGMIGGMVLIIPLWAPNIDAEKNSAEYEKSIIEIRR